MENEAIISQKLRQGQVKSAAAARKHISIGGGELEKLRKLAANKEKIVTFVMVPIIAGGNAALNYLGIGAIPIIGDVIDLGAGVSLSAFLLTLEGHPRWKAQALVWSLTAVELLPMADFFSPQAIGAALALMIAWHAGQQAEERIEQIQKDVDKIRLCLT